jgi:phage/plasmid-like protein (TIGR03299 family)
MSHEIAKTADGRDAMAYTGKTPWHGLGQALTPDADLETWRREAGLDYEVREAEVQFTTEGGDVLRAPGNKVLYRGDTDASLAVVGSRYQVVQPGDVLEFYRDLVEQFGWRIETAGVLFDGRRVWALARAPEEDFTAAGDEMQGYVLLGTSYDGSMATVASHTTVRVVCHNTLSLAVGAGGDKGDIRIPHSTAFDAEWVQAKLGVRSDLIWKFRSNVEAMARRTVTKDEAVRFILNTFYGHHDEIEMTKRVENRIEYLIDLWNSAPGQETDAARGTAWGLVNLVTYYEDHEKRARSEENRMDSSAWGLGASKKAQAVREARKLVAA